MSKVYINAGAAISAQATFDGGFLENAVINRQDVFLPAIEPDYKAFISPVASRRMSKAVKMAIIASAQALNESGVSVPDAIITGTGAGCIIDSEKFLKAIIDNDEQFLTPTSFIQSTHNTVGAQIALGLNCKGYNFTYVNGAVSFESALLDAIMQIELQQANNVLVGGVDEMTPYFLELQQMIGHAKSDIATVGSVQSEGAGFFVLANTPTESTYAAIEDVTLYNKLSIAELPSFITGFLRKHHLEPSQIDLVVAGNNGDVFDDYYDKAAHLFRNYAITVQYKQLTGEYFTVSAFALWLASRIIKEQHIPEILKPHAVKHKAIKNVLIYNQYRGLDHSLILLKRV
ncbi:beta-ketoacyl synthase N-terminal-like domain-containing protein [Polluticaenibacter yanchengensis]|uniref:Beta-ketoacyl synthase N-terminal-like domain-containing protein n=1 Tax=Polluticaenibacter yanchengensis TaxID=3014562 RepID=A0ABT4UMD2_9BACT|nr:beta-ketoacyl synthase N-terminal-like domain-containing protein [Chitinophagaceae bacterium LY-5]